MLKKVFKRMFVFLLISALFVAAGCSKSAVTPTPSPDKPKVDDPMAYSGTVKFAVQEINQTYILGNIAKLLIEKNSGLKVDLSTNLSGVAVMHGAMKQGDVDMYHNWTGTALMDILKYEGPRLSREDTIKYVTEKSKEKDKVVWTKPVGYNDTYVMLVRKEIAEKYNLKKASDLASYAKDWTLAGDNTFDTQPDAYPGWSKAYDIKFKKVLALEYSVIYTALANAQVDVIAAYSSDSRIAKFGFVILEDDKNFFPFYDSSFVIRGEVLAKYPKLQEILEQVSGKIGEKEMLAMNLKYDDDKVAPELIAREFLKSLGLL